MTDGLTRSTRRSTDRALLQRTAELAADFLESLDERPVAPRAGRDELLASLGGPLPGAGIPATDVIEDLARDGEPGVVGMAGPRYFGFVIGGSLPAALAADWLTSTWDQNAGLFAAGPSASVVEEVIGSWLVDLLGLPEGTSIGLTTGCQMAHVTCLAAARHRVLERAGWDVEDRGLFGAPEIAVVIGSEAHATIPTALQYLGMGRSRVISVESDEQGRMRLDLLAEALPAGNGPLIVSLQAGNVNTGSFDPIGPAIELIRDRHPEAWIHVDGAFGLWAAASPAYRHLARRARGSRLVGHRRPQVAQRAVRLRLRVRARPKRPRRCPVAAQGAAYIVYGSAERDEFRWVPEYSRRARGFPTYAALRSLGRDGVREMVERGCRLATRMADGLRASGVEILNDVVLDQILARFHPADGGDADAWTRQVISRVQADGTCWLSGTTWHGMAAMRISIVNWSTTEDDIDRSLAAILEAARDG